MPLFDSPDLGLQVLVYDPASGEVEDLTEGIGRGFGNTSLRYAWSMEQSGGDIFVGTNLLNPDALGFFKLAFRAENGLLTADALANQYDLLNDIGYNTIPADTGDYGVYRYRDGTWTQVLGSEIEAEFGGVGVRELRKIVVDDGGEERSFLFAGTVNDPVPGNDNEEAAQLWVSEDNGDTWEQIVTGASGPDSTNSGYRNIVQWDDLVLLGTQDANGSSLWSYDPLTGEWNLIDTLEDVAIIASLEVVEEPSGEMALYVGYSSGVAVDEPIQISRYVEDDGSPTGWSGEEVTPHTFLRPDGTRVYRDGETGGVDEHGDPLGVDENPFDDDSLLTMWHTNGRLYIGTSDDIGSAGLAYIDLGDDPDDPIDPEGWQLVTTDGFGNDGNNYIWSVAVDDSGGPGNEVTYIGTYDVTGEFDVFASSDGDNWYEITDDGFGTANNWGAREMAMLESDPGKLLIGTASITLIPSFDEAPNDDLFDRREVVWRADKALVGTGVDDWFVGKFGGNTLIGYGGNDFLLGGAGDDTVRGNTGNDDLSGERGDDHLYGGFGDDYLAGGRGEDVLVDGGGLDTMAGNGAADTFILVSDGERDVIVDLDFGEGDEIVLLNAIGVPLLVEPAVQETDDGLEWVVDGVVEVVALGLTAEDLPT